MRSARTSEPGKLPAGLLAILVHLGFLALLVFGVTWRTQSPAPVTAELWQSLPAPPKVAPVQPPPKQEVPPPEPKPEPRPEPKAEPEPPKPDIALQKEKEEKLKREQEEKIKLEEERKKDLERKKQEELQKKRDEEEHKKQEKLKEEQTRKLAAQKEAQAKAQAEQEARAAADAKLNEFRDKIIAKIRSNMIIPQDLVGNPQVIYEITLLPTGDILSVRLVKTSGFPSYDAAAERAITKSAPLPVPSGDLFQSKFRVGNYQFRPNDQ